jgi:ABC-type uncharacterized transport system ATPase subunit
MQIFQVLVILKEGQEITQGKVSTVQAHGPQRTRTLRQTFE